MKRCLGLFALVAVVVAGSATAAVAQPARDEWTVVVAPYLMGAAMSGATTVRGFTVDVDASASDIFSKLEFGAMGVMVAQKGVWGFGADAIWMALGTTVEDTDVDFNQGAFAFYGLRELGPAAAVTFGLRVNTLQGELTFKGPDVTRNQNKTWVDPIAGVILRTPPNRRAQVRLYSEVGGFGVGSDFTWQLFPTLSLRLTDNASFEFGYRWLDVDYTTGEGTQEFRYDVLTQGPVLGFGLRF